MAQQSILGRITQMARANINALLDAAEDPEKMLEQMIRDYKNNISEAEAAAAQTIGNLRMMEGDQREAQSAAAEWGAKAAAAATKSRELKMSSPEEADRFENLARVALKRQITFEDQVRDMGPTIAQQTEVVEKLKSGLTAMSTKLEELTGKRDELIARAKMAQAQAHVHDALTTVTIIDPTSELARFEERIRREEAKVQGQQELSASSLDAQFDHLEDVAEDAEVERRLAELTQH